MCKNIAQSRLSNGIPLTLEKAHYNRQHLVHTMQIRQAAISIDRPNMSSMLVIMQRHHRAKAEHSKMMRQRIWNDL